MSASAPSAPVAPALSSAVKAVRTFVAHPDTNTAFGLALAGLSQFTAAVPAADRASSTYLGLAYSIAVQLVDWLKSATAS